MIDDPDDLAGLLAPRPGGSPNPAALLAVTAGVLRRRARLRRAARGVGVSLVFALGGVAGWVLKPSPEPRVVTVVEVAPAPVAQPVAAPADRPMSATELELLAEQADTPAEAANLYRAAGDRFLKDAGDYEQAVRCYRLYFRHAGAEARTVSADDSWLLMSLKTSYPKENRDAKSDS